jgi:hypothetical protein
MRHNFVFAFIALVVWISGVSRSYAADETDANGGEVELNEIIVNASRVANTRPAGTYAAMATELRFDPETELQSRGLAEGQSDVTVQGGVFENTGFVVGAVTVMDPQTGHYTADLPLDPAILSSPSILTGIDNALVSFNASIATVHYTIRRLQDGGAVLLGAGSDDLSFGSLRFARSTTLKSGSEFGAAVSLASSQGDGSLPFGDHEFERYNLHLQRSNDSAQTDLIASYQDKFYGWPGAYTGFATLPETDHTKTTLIMLNHRKETSNGWWEAGAYYRILDDNYDFNRTTQESGAPGSFDHKTKIYAAGIQGSIQSGAIDWRYGGQLTADELVRSTDLVNAPFTKRSYATFSVVPTIDIARSNNRTITLRAGATVDASNRDSNQVSPLVGATIHETTESGVRYLGFEYARSSQLPGYTALGSPPAGLFGGNADLGREKASQLSITFGREAADWSGSATLFYRQDDDLVDWTYATGAPFSRQANPVDLDVTGIDLMASRYWAAVDLIAGYTYLDKDSDYGSSLVDASYYALNFASHRATLAIRYRVTDRLELRFDNEYRVQEDNALRTSDDNAFSASIAIAWVPGGGRGLGLALVADNVTDNDYEFFPGTPALGRQINLSVSYDW